MNVNAHELQGIERWGRRVAVAGVALALIFIGGLKFTSIEVEALQPLIGGTPWIAWTYGVFGHVGTSRLLGVVEIATGLLLIASMRMPLAGIVGGTIATVLFLVTCSMLLAQPIWEARSGGFPALNGLGAFLIKDITLLGVSLTALGEGLARRLAIRPASSRWVPRNAGAAARARTGDAVSTLRRTSFYALPLRASRSLPARGAARRTMLVLALCAWPAAAHSHAVIASPPVVHVKLAEWIVTLSPEQVPSGPVIFEVTNTGTIPHAFEIEGGGIEKDLPPIQPGASARLQVMLAPGHYEAYCPVGSGSHRMLGMERDLEVRRVEEPAMRYQASVTPDAAGSVSVPAGHGDSRVAVHSMTRCPALLPLQPRTARAGSSCWTVCRRRTSLSTHASEV